MQFSMWECYGQGNEWTGDLMITGSSSGQVIYSST